MRRKTIQKEWVEETNMVSEIELIYHSKVKSADRPLIINSRDAYKVLLNTWNKDTIDLQEEFKVILIWCSPFLGQEVGLIKTVSVLRK